MSVIWNLSVEDLKKKAKKEFLMLSIKKKIQNII